MYLLLFNLFHSSTTDFTVTVILCNVQLTMLERFSAILAIHRVSEKCPLHLKYVLALPWENRSIGLSCQRNN